MGKRILVALGGNAILQPGQKGTSAEQVTNIDKTVKQLIDVVEKGYELVLTHGNGPQVGAILIQHEMAKEAIPAMPLDFCGAESQGLIGYMLCQSIRNECAGRGLKKEAVCIVTQVEVDPHDKAFRNLLSLSAPFILRQKRNRIWLSGVNAGSRMPEGLAKVVPSPELRKL